MIAQAEQAELRSVQAAADFERELGELIEANRDQALWFMPRDFTPETPEAVRRTLERIAARGSRTTFVRARQLLRQLNTPA